MSQYIIFLPLSIIQWKFNGNLSSYSKGDSMIIEGGEVQEQREIIGRQFEEDNFYSLNLNHFHQSRDDMQTNNMVRTQDTTRPLPRINWIIDYRSSAGEANFSIAGGERKRSTTGGFTAGDG